MNQQQCFEAIRDAIVDNTANISPGEYLDVLVDVRDYVNTLIEEAEADAEED